MRSLLLVLALAAAPSAQTAAGDAAGAAHRLPWPSAGDAPHEIALAVGGVGGPVAVVVASAPAWAVFDASRADAVVVAGDAAGEPEARLSFRVAAGAVAEAPGDVVLHVVGADGRVLAAHAVSLVVAPPARLAVSAPRPNPSRGSATVDVAVPSAGRVRVSVVDVLGREVAVALDGAREAGGVTVPVDGGRLASGVYVVRAEAGGRVAATRLTVVR